MQLPFVTNNGNHVDDLIAQNAGVAEALSALSVALLAALPHGRNYASDEDYQKAESEYRIKMEWIRAMRKDCDAMDEHLYNIRELRSKK